jgi:hypothetical protein
MYSYRQENLDDSILFSIDHPKANRKDCYRIKGLDERRLVLAGEEERVCSGERRGPHLAIAVSSHGIRDIVATLNLDGTKQLHMS